MISLHLSKLSQLVPDETSSFLYQSAAAHTLREQLGAVRGELRRLAGTFEQFKEQTLSAVNESMGKITTLMYRQLKEKLLLETELEKSKQVQQTMRNEVLQLKEMINEAMVDYAKDLQNKDRDIALLCQKLHRLQQQPPEDEKNAQEILIEESRKTDKQVDLDIIQEESSNGTYSSATSICDFRDERENQKVPILDVEESRIMKEKENQEPREHKKTKSFIDHFRKTIEESFSEKNPPKQDQPRLNVSMKEPLKEVQSQNYISNQMVNHMTNQMGNQMTNQMGNQMNNKMGNQLEQEKKSYSQLLKECVKEPVPISFKTVYMNDANQISKSSSSSDLVLADTDKINPPKKFETPTNLMLFKKKEAAHRIMTEPSPERPSSHSNITETSYFSSKPATSHKRIFTQSKVNERSSSHEDNKSIKSSMSREKIKVTAKMIEDSVHMPKKTATKALVYLGGKSLFRKFLLEIKAAVKKLTIVTVPPEDEIKYEGSKRNGLKHGKGRSYYRNGAVYEGQFKDNTRHGKGSIFMNGIIIFQGLWQCDRLHGEGYIKSLRYMAAACPPIFYEASFIGNIVDNRFNGMGTLILNPKEKIVTKFAGGCPTGDLTYYNINEIEFGVWPSD